MPVQREWLTPLGFGSAVALISGALTATTAHTQRHTNNEGAV